MLPSINVNYDYSLFLAFHGSEKCTSHIYIYIVNAGHWCEPRNRSSIQLTSSYQHGARCVTHVYGSTTRCKYAAYITESRAIHHIRKPSMCRFDDPLNLNHKPCLPRKPLLCMYHYFTWMCEILFFWNDNSAYRWLVGPFNTGNIVRYSTKLTRARSWTPVLKVHGHKCIVSSLPTDKATKRNETGAMLLQMYLAE
jgi:hypothetical protein